MINLKQLRTEYRFEEGYKLTKNEIFNRPDDIWAKRNHSWSIYYMIKKHVQAGETTQARHFLHEFTSLQMPSDETLLHERMQYFITVLDAGYLAVKQLVSEGKFSEAFDIQLKSLSPDQEQLSWITYYLLKAYNKSEKPQKNEVLELLARFFEKYLPSKILVSKLIIQELIKTPLELWNDQSQVEYLEKAGLFGVLDEDDYQKQEWEGKKIISLAERLHITYCKALLREKWAVQKIQSYITHIVEPILEKYPNMLYVPYFKAKLLLGTGEKESGIKAFLPFAKKKSGEFWVWQIFAEAYEADKNLYFSCLCKAMTCKTKPEFLSNILERVIAFLVKEEKYELAKGELDKLIQLREKQSWGLRLIHRQHLSSSWYQKASISLLNYTEYIKAAEALLSGSLRCVNVVISHVNKEKRVFSFLIEENKSGFGKYSIEPDLWQIYSLEGSFGEGDFFQIKNFSKLENQEHPLVRSVTGKFTKQDYNPFGFVKRIFVDPYLTKQHDLNHDDWIQGKAIFAPVKGKKEWAWKMVEIRKIEERNES